MIALIVAFTKKYHVIGSNNTIPWHLKSDMARFKTLTTGAAVIMGRNTYKSINHPLPNRFNIIVTSTPDIAKPLSDTLAVAKNVADAIFIAKSRGYDKIFLCGGSRIYNEGFSFCDTLFITIVDKTYAGDAFWPNLNLKDFTLTQKLREKDCTFLTFKKG